MERRRKYSFPLEVPSIVERNEIMQLTKRAKAWEFTCSFCFKKFPSAQAMGGHQNAHRKERMDERRLYVKDPIGYRKRAYILAMKAALSSTADGPNLNALKCEVESNYGPPKVLENTIDDVMAFNGSTHQIQDSPKQPKTLPIVLMNFLPPKELSLVETFGVRGEDTKGKACMELVGVYGIGLDDKLDLTLKL